MSPAERGARQRATQMVEEAAIIEMTSWTFATLDRQPNDRMRGLLAVIGTRDAIEREERRSRGH